MTKAPEFTGWPKKSGKGFSVTIWFKSMAEALNWMYHAGVISRDNAPQLLENDEKIQIANVRKETRWLRGQLKKWLKW